MTLDGIANLQRMAAKQARMARELRDSARNASDRSIAVTMQLESMHSYFMARTLLSANRRWGGTVFISFDHSTR
jgi:hypothetical protein